MRVWSERSSCTARAAYLLKIAVCTIPRCGIAAIVFLFLGILALFPAFTQYRTYQIIQNTPIQLSAAVLGDGVSLADVKAIDGVESATPVLRIDGQLIGKEAQWSGQILAIDGHFLNIQLKEGQRFPARSNMPVLLVNPAAGFSYGETLRLQINGREWAALVCGILNDESPEPAAYMSYATAADLWPHPRCREMLLRLSGKAQLAEASAQLQRYGILVGIEPDAQDSAPGLLRESGFLFVLSISFLSCALVLLRDRQRLECIQHRDEILALSVTGDISFGQLVLHRNAVLVFLLIPLSAAIAVAWNWFCLQAVVMGLAVFFFVSSGGAMGINIFFGM